MEALFGGAAGGGKSDALIMAALQYVEVPGYAALLLRRTYADLVKPGALMDRAGDWLRPTAAHWRDQAKTWVFPSGATISFGFLQTENDKFNYQSSELDFVGFDELSQFSETSYQYLFSRIRRLHGSVVPSRMRGATNPGSEWVKLRFGIEAGRDEPVQWTDGYWAEDDLWVEPRAFVRSLLSDNDAVDAVAYRRSLANLDPMTRQQLLRGDWDVRPEGKLFKREWFQIVEAGPG